MNKSATTSSVAWLSDDLAQNIRVIFEPRYNRKLTDFEVSDIAENITNSMETLLKWGWNKYGNT
jgi:hypothetical protein